MSSGGASGAGATACGRFDQSGKVYELDDRAENKSLTVREPIVQAIAQVLKPIFHTSNFVSPLVYITREPLV